MSGRLGVLQRKRALEGAWAWSLLVALLAAALPWFLRALPLDLGRSARTAFLGALLFSVAAAATDLLRSPLALQVSSLAIQLLGVALLARVWQLAGGLENPLFLLAFVPPVVASGVLWPGLAPLLIATASTVAAAAVALVESPELPWYLVQAGAPIEPILRLLPLQPAGSPGLLPGARASLAYVALVLESFLVLELGCALLSSRLGRVAARLATQRAVARPLRSEALFEAVFASAPDPAVVVMAETSAVVRANTEFARQMLLHGVELRGRDLFDLLAFADPAGVRSRLAAQAPGVGVCRYRVGQEERVARLGVHPLRLGGERLACAAFEELTPEASLALAAGASREPLLVLDASRKLRYSNEAAERLLGELYPGLEAERLPGLPPDWWSAAGPERVEVGERSYAIARARAAAGEPDELTVLWLSHAG